MSHRILNSFQDYSSVSMVPYPTAAAAAALLLDTYTNAKLAFGFRKLRTAYAGFAVTIRRSSDNAQADIGFSGNDFDSAAAATHIGGGTGFIAKWYDQSGNGYDISNATAATQPLYQASGIGSKPGANMDTNNRGLATVTDAVIGASNKWSVFAVADLNSSAASFGRLAGLIATGQGNDFAATGCAAFILRDSTNANIHAYLGGSPRGLVSVTYDTANVLVSIFDSANHIFYKDTSAGTTVATTASIGDAGGSTVRVGCDNAASLWCGRCSEVVFWASDQTASLSGIDADMGTYYGL